MLGFVIRRLLSSLVVLFVASVLVFAIIATAGSPLSGLKAGSRDPRAAERLIAAKRKELNLDKSVPQRYVLWAKDFVGGRLGNDNDGNPVRPQLTRAFQVTLRMSLAATFLALILAIFVGVYSAVRQYSISDYAFTFGGFLFLSMPVFWLAALLKEFLGIRINRAWGSTIVYTLGEQSPDLSGSFWHRMGDYAGHLALPTLALALIAFAGWSRYQRATMLDVMNSDYVRLARAKGLSNSRVLIRHALRNALIPLTTVVAIDVGAVFAGAVITETVFSWQGMGKLLVTSITNYDPNMLLAWLMVTGTFVILFNLLADILYGVLDPRIRVS